MPRNRSRVTLPRHAGIRVVLELVAVVVWPLELVGILLLPLAPFTAVAVAEAERWRARECGEDVAPLHPTGGSLTWARRRVATLALWRSDAPITVASLVVGPVSGMTALLGGIGGVVMVAAPALQTSGVAVNVGPWVADTPASAWVMAPAGLLLLVVTAALLVLVSVGRDAAVRGLGGHEAQQLTRELGSVRSSRVSMLEAFEAERRRIERDLHDGAQQDLLALSITLGILEHRASALSGEDAEYVRTLARRAHEQSDRALVRLRETVHGIHPRELTDLGLLAALRHLVARAPLHVELTGSGDDEAVPAAVAAAAYFVVAEALTNASVHAGVDRARVEAHVERDRVRVVVRDEGAGGARLDAERSPAAGTGLAGLRERVRALGGELFVDSPTGAGTTITATVPLVPSWPDRLEARMNA